jgi:hypothetical protein
MPYKFVWGAVVGNSRQIFALATVFGARLCTLRGIIQSLSFSEPNLTLVFPFYCGERMCSGLYCSEAKDLELRITFSNFLME